ncbi:hypothetical protein Hypma_012098, partial [Hypsizygus marmoreus]
MRMFIEWERSSCPVVMLAWIWALQEMNEARISKPASGPHPGVNALNTGFELPIMPIITRGWRVPSDRSLRMSTMEECSARGPVLSSSLAHDLSVDVS